MAITEEEKNKAVFDQTPVEETPKKKLPKGAKIAIIVTGSIVGALALTWAGANILKYPIYADYWSRQHDLYEIPGLSEGKVPQGCAYDKNKKVVYTTSYSNEGAYIYVVGDNGTIAHPLKSNGERFKGHAGGISTSGNYAFIANDDRIYTVKTSELNDKELEYIDIGEGIKVNNQASFTFANDTYLWVGEFNNSKEYVTNHPVGNNKAIITKYDVQDFYFGSSNPTPLEIISITDEVQGCAFFDNTMVLSTSWGLNTSKFLVYDTHDFEETFEVIDGLNVKKTTKDPQVINAPLMMEDLDVYDDGTIITLTESACNKYIIGKFLFYTKIVTVKIK